MRLLIVVLFCVSTYSYAADMKIELGEYEMSIQNKVSGLPANLPAAARDAINKTVTQKVCIKDRTTKGFIGSLMNNTNCEMGPFKQKGNTISWKGKCSARLEMKTEGSMTVARKSYHGQNIAITKIPNAEEMKIVSEYKGHKIGECK